MYHYSRIRDLREDSEKRQQDIADYLGIHRTMYRRYETGETDLPCRYLVALADFYNTSADYILGRAKNKKIPLSK